MSKSKYTLSFTTGAALIYESVEVASLYSKFLNWADVRTRVIADNSFQSRTESTLKKLFGEVSRRLRHLTNEQLDLLATGTEAQQRALVWLAICRQYRFVYDFTVKAIVPQYDAARFLLTAEDYDVFFNANAEWHDNLDLASQQTKSKARQVVFKMLRECGIIDFDNELQHQELDESLRHQIMIRPDDLRLFLGNG